MSIDVKGMQETQREMGRIVEDLRGNVMMGGMAQATLILQRAVKMNFVGYQSPEVGGVDTGLTRASIMPAVRVAGFGGRTIQGVVGSNRMSALIQEQGAPPHWPVPKGESLKESPIGIWARRHGASAYVVACAIARRGNIARHQFTRALNDNIEKIVAVLGGTVARIVRG